MTSTFTFASSAKASTGMKISHPALFRSLKENGIHLSNSMPSDLLVALNHNEETYGNFLNSGGNSRNTVLIRLEPDVVFPLQYKTAVEEKYSLVITPGSVLDFKSQEFFVGWPYRFNLNPSKPSVLDPDLSSITSKASWRFNFQLKNWQERPVTLAMVAANKVSPIKTSNYAIRRDLAANLSPDLLHVYGPFWEKGLKEKIRHRAAVTLSNVRQGVLPNPSAIYGDLFRKYPTAHGSIADKYDLICKAKFSLVVENSNTYISEKLIDAIVGGSVPIYIGPNLKDVGLPTDIVISASGNTKEVMGIIADSDEKLIERTLHSMNEFLESSLFLDMWSEVSVYKKISSKIATLMMEISK